MSKNNKGARRLEEAVKAHGPAYVAVELDCTVTTVYNLLEGSSPSLRVANAAKIAFKIPTEAWSGT